LENKIPVLMQAALSAHNSLHLTLYT